MGLTRIRAEQISDIDYKQAVRVVTTSNVTLVGSAPNVVDGVSLALNDRILVTGQSTGSQNGLYYVTTLGTGSNGTWQRSFDGDNAGEIMAGMIVMVTEGSSYADTQWKLTTNDPIVLDSSSLTFVLNVGSIVGGLNTQIQYNNGGVMAGSANLVFTGGNNLTVTGTETVTGNITGGNILTSGLVSATGNITGGNLSGTNITGTLATAAQTNITSVGTLSSLTVTANVTGGNILTAGVMSSTSNVTGGNLLTAGLISATGNITGGNLSGTNIVGTLTTAAQTNITSVGTLTSLNSGAISSSGNVTGANLVTGGLVTATSNVTGGNILTAGLMSSTGNITGGNLVTGGLISATANVTANNVTATNWINSANVSASGNVLVSGYVSVVGNLYVANVVASSNLVVQDPLVYLTANSTYPYNYDIGLYSQFTGGAGNTYQHTGLVRDYTDNTWKLFSNAPEPTGTVVDFTNAIYDPLKTGAISVNGLVSASGNVTGGNILTAGVMSSTGNATHGNILTAGLISATGNVTGGNLIAGTGTGGNITGANLISATNFTGTNATFTTANVTTTNGGTINSTANVNITPNFGTNTATTTWVSRLLFDNSYNDIARGPNKIELYNSTWLGGFGVNSNTLSTYSGGNLSFYSGATAYNTVGTEVLRIHGGGLSVVGTITTGTSNIAGGNIVNNNANGVGNIGTTGGYFNTVFAKATSAVYADLAELYLADADYPVGTLLRFGGSQEVTQTVNSHETSVAGTVSDKPAHVMNAELKGDHVVPLVLTGRVPCRVIGTISKGDLLVASEIYGVATVMDPDLWVPGCIFGKALENYDSDQEGIIEVVVGKC